MTSQKSNYLQYLPPALWRDEAESQEFSLGRFLLPFEKVLTGINDSVPFIQDNFRHESIDHTLDVLNELYNPFKVQSDDSEWCEDWLAYLASWVGLSFMPTWDEHQRRKLIADAVDIHNIRGLKKGLYKYLELYLVSELKPRIAIDIGESVFRLPLEDNLNNHAQVITSGPPIIHPLSVQVDKTSPSFTGQIIIGDHDPNGSEAAKIWRIKPTGEYEFNTTVSGGNRYYPLYNGDPLTHINLTPPNSLVDGKPILTPAAIVDDYDGYYGIADSGSEVSGSASKILRISKLPPYMATMVSLVWTGLPMIKAIDMAINNSGNYVVLDRGNFDLDLPVGYTGDPLDVCKVLVIQTDGGGDGRTSVSGTILTQIDLSIIVEPVAIALHPDGDFIIADIGDSKHGAGGPEGTDGISITNTGTFTSATATFITSSVKVGDTLNIISGNDSADSPYQILQVVSETELLISTLHGTFVGDAGQSWQVYRRTEIYKVDSTTGDTTSLLNGISVQQSLPVNPVALLVQDAEHVLILDYGVKVRLGTKPIVQPARIWRLAIPPAAPNIEVISEDIGFVWPTDMSMDLSENIIIVDQGEPPDNRDWRSPPHSMGHEFGIVLHFSDPAHPASYRAARTIHEIIEKERPADMYFTMKR